MNSGNDPIQVSYKLTEKELREGLRKHGGVVVKILPVIGMVLIASGLSTLMQKPREYSSAGGPFLIGIFAFFLARAYTRPRQGGSRLLEEVKVTISDSGIESSNLVTTTRSTWDAYVRYVETENLFLVYYGSPLLLTLFPKRAFALQETDVFRGLLEHYLGSASKTYRKKITKKTLVFVIVVAIAVILLVVTNLMIRQREKSASVRFLEAADPLARMTFSEGK